MNNISSDVERVWSSYVPELDPTVQHFSIGDRAWIVDNTGEPTEVEITEIYDVSHNRNSPGGYIFYWYHHVNKPHKCIQWFDLMAIKLGRFLKVRNIKIPSYMGPGHSVLAGKDETLHKTLRHAMLDHGFATIMYYS